MVADLFIYIVFVPTLHSSACLKEAFYFSYRTR